MYPQVDKCGHRKADVPKGLWIYLLQAQVVFWEHCYLIASIGCSWNMFLHWAHFIFRSSSPWVGDRW